jgi:MFS family permease
MTVTFLQPTLAIHLTSFGYQELFVGLSFALPTLIYAITCSFIYKLTKIYKKSGVIFIGYGVTSIGMLLIGPSQMLGVIESEKITMAGLCIMGFGAAMIIIPVMPDMIDVAE